MIFTATPVRQNAPSQLLALSSIVGTTTVSGSSSGGNGSAASVTLTNVPTIGTVGIAWMIAGTVSPAVTAVQVGISESVTVAPTSWVTATVSSTDWTVSVTPSAAGTYYIWAEQTSDTSVQTISSAVTVTVGSSSGSALTYSLISGSGNSSLSGVTLTTASDNVADWSSSIVAGATDVRPGVTPSSLGSITACSFWFDTSATNTVVPTSDYGNAGSFNNGTISFYPYSAGYGLPTCVPPAPSTTGTYYGKYAMYDSSNDLLGVFTTSAITIT